MADVRDVNLNRLAIFVAVVEAGSLTAAAARLGLAKTMVSTHIQRLEREVGASLLVRTTRRLSVTESGRAFYEASCRILAAAEEALSAVAGEVGAVARHAAREFADRLWFAWSSRPRWSRCAARIRNSTSNWYATISYVDLIAEGIDVAIRLGRLADSNYRAVKIGGFVKWIVASPAFVEHVG